MDKVYELVGSRWADQGTAFCLGQFQEETGEALLIARSERDFNDVILRTVIHSNDVYQRQQGVSFLYRHKLLPLNNSSTCAPFQRPLSYGRSQMELTMHSVSKILKDVLKFGISLLKFNNI